MYSHTLKKAAISCQNACTQSFQANVNLELSVNGLPIATQASLRLYVKCLDIFTCTVYCMYKVVGEAGRDGTRWCVSLHHTFSHIHAYLYTHNASYINWNCICRQKCI